MSDEEYYYEGSDQEEDLHSDNGDFTPDTDRSDKGKQKAENIRYESYPPSQLEEQIIREISDVVTILGLELPIASILLRQYRWNKERLLDAYITSPEKVLNASGEPPLKIVPPLKRQRTSPNEFVCDICCDNVSNSEVFRERCNHAFCRNCWRDYITVKVKDEGQCDISCMQDKCPTVLMDATIRSLLDDLTHARYLDLILESFVGNKSHLRFCPFPGCNETISCHSATRSTRFTHVPIAFCSSSHPICFGCGMDADHRPVICDIAKLWLKNAKDDSGTSNWIQANTKDCPKCHNPTEKNGGCNRILCRNCQFQWCWMCQRNWDVHGYDGTCNAYLERAVTDTLSVQEQAKANLEKWYFYYDRYTNHEVSAKLDQELYAQTEKKIVEVQIASGLSWIQATFMKDAVDELSKCRITLKWSYAMAFYVQSDNMKQILEDVQADLEKAVEALSQMLEEDVTEKTVHSLRQRMLDKTVYVQRRHEALLDYVCTGLQEERWRWTVCLE